MRHCQKLTGSTGELLVPVVNDEWGTSPASWGLRLPCSLHSVEKKVLYTRQQNVAPERAGISDTQKGGQATLWGEPWPLAASLYF